MLIDKNAGLKFKESGKTSSGSYYLLNWLCVRQFGDQHENGECMHAQHNTCEPEVLEWKHSTRSLLGL